MAEAAPALVADITIPRSSLHPGQLEVVVHPARFKVVVAGRRWGKTRGAAFLCTLHALAGQRVWWIAPSYKLALIGWRRLLALARTVEGAYHVGFTLFYPNGGSITVRSAHDPESLRSEGLDFAVFDEAAFTNLSVAWVHSIRPALMDRRGRALFISTPFGQNAFWKLWKKGIDPHYPDWMAWRFKSWDNPFLPADEQQAMREEYLESGDTDILRQETEGEFLAEAGGVFRGIDGMLRDDLTLGRLPHRGHTHVCGWDPAKFVDNNAVILVDVNCREVVLMDVTRRINLTDQLQKIVDIMKVYPGRLWMDATRDETLVELAQNAGLAVDAVKFTATSKQDMVNRLAIVTERHRLKMPRVGTEMLVEELRGFRYQLAKWGGGIRYGAPAGEHDDRVTALGLCVLGMGDEAFIDRPADYVPAIAGKPGIFVEDLPRQPGGRAVFS